MSESNDPWQERKEVMRKRLAKTPPPKPKPDFRAIYARKKRQRDTEATE